MTFIEGSWVVIVNQRTGGCYTVESSTEGADDLVEKWRNEGYWSTAVEKQPMPPRPDAYDPHGDEKHRYYEEN